MEISDLPYSFASHMLLVSFPLLAFMFLAVSVLPLSHLYCVHLCYRNKLILCFALFFLHVSIFFFMDNFSLHSLIFSLPFLLITLKKEKKKSPSCGIVLKTVNYCVWGKKKIKRRGGEGVEWGWLVDLGKKRGKNSRTGLCSWTLMNHGHLLRLELKFCHRVVTKFMMTVHLW